MIKPERLRADHAEALPAFERENRSHFARTVPDRGDACFSEFPSRLRVLLAEQDAGVCHFHGVVDDRGDLVGRVDLVEVEDGRADLGYRVAERAAGRGVATGAVEEVCRPATEAHRLSALTAAATLDNPASRAVPARTGFTAVDGITLDGRPGVRYRRRLSPSAPHGPAA
ncbi:GNAT family N-acetyltransferase [Streptomyces sp. NBC_01275]|uniref:GNAT family N-acetyltransferase n=1 Tax=Streptomyces sp. NBC_01275 TaxID=2903807 RepID=UPI0022513703|nr:GNAT family N-acetyltransferase [Streptomyces sp. NBC_01275]MCX4766301.1 GNAT family N-acetyltransferase [Streptomyces sp. NBC_01275]